MLPITKSSSASSIKKGWQVPLMRHLARSIRQWSSIACVWSLVWMLFILWVELGVFRHTVNRCQWPTNKNWGAMAKQDMFRMAIVADPQIIDAYSYKQSPGLGLALTEFYTDIYMVKSFYYLQKLHQPDAILFLGDLFDGGREWQDDAWYPELNRFKWIFHRQPSYHGKMLYMAGNHDFGFGDKVVKPARARYEREFGPSNWSTQLGNHSIISLDTLSLSSRVTDIRNTSQTFLDDLSTQNKTLPRMLFTHVPLYRPDFRYCGPLRHASRGLYQGHGYQYQNLVVEDISKEILNKTKPDMVFAGDDHDQCLWKHHVNGVDIPEYTVGTFSWSMGNPFPAFGMLSLYNPSGNATNGGSTSSATAVYDVCFLPFQIGTYIGYGVLALVTLIIIILQLRYNRVHRPFRGLTPVRTSLVSATLATMLQIVFIVVVFYIFVIVMQYTQMNGTSPNT